MAYLPPLNGGRLNASLSGNSTSAGAGYRLMSTGTMYLAGGNNITLSQNGASVTISGANVPSGSINFSASNASANLASVNFSNSNGVSFGLNGSTITASHNGITSQTVQTQGLQSAIAGTGTLTAGALSFANSNGVTFGLNNGTLTASANAGGGSITAGGTTYTSGVSLVPSGALTISGTNNQSLSLSVPSVSSISGTGIVNISTNGGTISIGASQSVQTQNIIQGIIANTGTASTGTVSFANGNGVSFGLSTNNVLTASVSAQSNQLLSIYGSGNTTGGSSSSARDARSLSISGGGAVSVGFSSNSVFMISAPTQTAQTQSNIQGLYDGANSISTGTIRLSNLNGISFGINGQTLTGSHNGITSQTNQTLGFSASGNTTMTSTGTFDARSMVVRGMGNVSVGMSNGTMLISETGGGFALANSQTTYSTGTANLLEGGGAITIASTTGQKFNFSVPQTSSLSATGIVSLSTNGGTISIGASQSNQTIGFSALGNTALTSTGTFDARSLNISGAGNLTVGISNGTIRLSAAGGGGGGSISAGGTNYTNGVSLVPSGALTISGTNNQSLSLSVPSVSSMSATGILSMSVTGGTVSMGVPAYSAGISTQGNTAGTTGFATNQLQFVGSNMISLSQSTGAGGNTLTINATQSVQTQSRFNLTLGGNSTSAGAGYAQISSGTMLLAGGNNVTLSQNGNSVTVSAASQSAQTQSNIQGLYDGANSISTGTVRLSNLNGISFGINGQTLTGSHNGITSQTNQTISFSAGSQSTLTAAGTMDARSFVLNGVGAASVGFSNSSGFVSVPVQTNQTLGFTATGTNTTMNTTGSFDARSMVVSGGGIIKVGISSNTLHISATGGGGGGVAIVGSNSTYSSGSLSLTGAGALTVTNGANILSLSVPAASSLVGINGITLSTNGSTISISGPGNVALTTLSRWEHPQIFQAISTFVNSSLSLQHVYVPFNVTATAAKIAGSVTVNTSTAAQTASANFSLNIGIYSLNGSTLSLITASSGSANNAFTWQGASGSTTGLTGVTGLRQLTVPMNVNMTPGEYWVGAVLRSASSGLSAGMTVYGNNQIANTGAIGILGSATSAGRDAFLGQGMYTSTVTALPASIPLASINNVSASNAVRAAFYHVLYNATF
jgi:hypothetical protein